MRIIVALIALLIGAASSAQVVTDNGGLSLAPITATSTGGGGAGVPSAPTSPSATGGANQIVFSWTASATATSYSVLCSSITGGPYTSVGTVSTVGFTYSGLGNGVTYYCVIQATNGSGSSAYSSQVSATTTGGSGAPAAVTGLISAPNNPNQITLVWNASTGATSYKVLRSTTSGGPYTQVGSPTGTVDQDVGLPASTTYYYVVQAVNASGSSANSTQTSSTTLSTGGGGVTIPSIPIGVTATAGNAQVVLGWTASAGATSYNVLRSTTSGSGYTQLANINTTAYTDGTVSNGPTYYYVIEAVNSAGTSANSSQVSATPTSGSSNGCGTNSYTLKFDDEFASFAGSPTSTASWQTCYPFDVCARTNNFPMPEGEYDSDATVGNNPFSVIGGGGLQIQATLASVTGANSAGATYNSGLIASYQTFNMAYGCFVARMKMPQYQGGWPPGLWPAFKLIPTNFSYPPEIDIVEAIGPTTQINSTLHYGTRASPMQEAIVPTVADVTAAYHTYAVDWEPTTVTFYFDGVSTGSFSTPAGMNIPMYMLNQLAVGTTCGVFAGCVSNNAEFPANLSIQYIRAYASSNSTGISGTGVIGATPAAPTGLTATPANTQISLSWTASSGATSYNVLRSTTNGSGYSLISTTASTSYTNTGLINGTTYYYVVQAVAGTATSANSTQASATPSSGGGGTNGIWTNVTPSSVNLTSNLDCGNYGTESVQADTANAGVLYTEFNCQGIYKSTDYGATWTGPINTGTNGAVVGDCAGGITVAPNGATPTIYEACIRGGNISTGASASGSAQGFWKSTDGGVNWTSYNITPLAASRQDVYPPVIDPYDTAHLLMAGHEQDFILESTNGGATWASIPLNCPGSGQTMCENGGTASIFFINTGSSGATRTTWLWIGQTNGGTYGTWRTTNGGASATWTAVSKNEHPHGSSQIYQIGTTGAVFMAGAYAAGGWGVQRSLDYGQTWQQVGATTIETNVWGTSNAIYAMYGYPVGIGGTNNASFEHASVPGNTGWANYNVPTGLAQGSAWIATVNNGANNIFVGGMWNSGLWRYMEANGGGGTNLRPGYNTGTGLFVLNGAVYDSNSVPFKIRGVDLDQPLGTNSQPGMSNANVNNARFAVRDGDGSAATYATYITNNMVAYKQVAVPVVFNAGGYLMSGNTNDAALTAAVSWWTSNYSALSGVQKHMVLNIANEWNGSSQSDWATQYATAIAAIRSAGYTCTIMIDAYDYAQDLTSLQSHASALFNDDPQKNVIFALHSYGNSATVLSANQLSTMAGLASSTGAAFALMEFGPANTTGPDPTSVQPQQLIAAADTAGIGWDSWAWEDPTALFDLTVGASGVFTGTPATASTSSQLTNPYGQTVVPYYGTAVKATDFP